MAFSNKPSNTPETPPPNHFPTHHFFFFFFCFFFTNYCLFFFFLFFVFFFLVQNPIFCLTHFFFFFLYPPPTKKKFFSPPPTTTIFFFFLFLHSFFQNFCFPGGPTAPRAAPTLPPQLGPAIQKPSPRVLGVFSPGPPDWGPFFPPHFQGNPGHARFWPPRPGLPGIRGNQDWGGGGSPGDGPARVETFAAPPPENFLTKTYQPKLGKQKRPANCRSHSAPSPFFFVFFSGPPPPFFFFFFFRGFRKKILGGGPGGNPPVGGGPPVPKTPRSFFFKVEKSAPGGPQAGPIHPGILLAVKKKFRNFFQYPKKIFLF